MHEVFKRRALVATQLEQLIRNYCQGENAQEEYQSAAQEILEAAIFLLKQGKMQCARALRLDTHRRANGIKPSPELQKRSAEFRRVLREVTEAVGKYRQDPELLELRKFLELLRSLLVVPTFWRTLDPERKGKVQHRALFRRRLHSLRESIERELASTARPAAACGESFLREPSEISFAGLFFSNPKKFLRRV